MCEKFRTMPELEGLSRREREVMEVLYREGKATAREVWSALGETVTYSTIRKILSILEEKRRVEHQSEGKSFVYSPTASRKKVASNAMSKLVETFYQGSVSGAVASLLGQQGHKMSAEELGRIRELIDEAERKGKGEES